MIFALLFNKNNPYRGMRLCLCGESISSWSVDKFPYHVRDCSLRPEISSNVVTQLEKEHGSSLSWVLELMKQCWSSSPSDRPLFREIVKIFDYNLFQKGTCVPVQFYLTSLEDGEEDELISNTKKVPVMNLVDISYKGLLELIERKWDEDVKVMEMSLIIDRDDGKKVICLSEESNLSVILDKEGLRRKNVKLLQEEEETEGEEEEEIKGTKEDNSSENNNMKVVEQVLKVLVKFDKKIDTGSIISSFLDRDAIITGERMKEIIEGMEQKHRKETEELSSIIRNQEKVLMLSSKSSLVNGSITSSSSPTSLSSGISRSTNSSFSLSSHDSNGSNVSNNIPLFRGIPVFSEDVAEEMVAERNRMSDQVKKKNQEIGDLQTELKKTKKILMKAMKRYYLRLKELEKKGRQGD